MTHFCIKHWIFRIFDCCRLHKNSRLMGASTAVLNNLENIQSVMFFLVDYEKTIVFHFV